MNEATFNLLYAVYSFPNILIPFIGGSLIDRVGARVMIIVTSGLCVVGQLIFSFGGQHSILLIMLAGRVVFGLGGEVLQASQSTIISNWFKPHQLPVSVQKRSSSWGSV
jgi:MFS family permease